MCPRGIPHSQFLAWRPKDQDKALAWQRAQRRVHTCGTDPDEWVTSAGKPVVPPPYELASAQCLGCQEMARFKKSDEFREGFEVVLLPVDPDEYDPEQFTGPSRAQIRDEAEVDE